MASYAVSLHFNMLNMPDVKLILFLSFHRVNPSSKKLVMYNRVNRNFAVCDSDFENNQKDENYASKFALKKISASKCPMCKQEVDFSSSWSSRSKMPPALSSARFVNPSYFETLLGVHCEEQKDEFDSDTDSKFNETDNNTGYYNKFFQEVKRLGTGSYGSVYLCKHIINGIEVGSYAVKKVVLSDDPLWQSRVFREARLLEKVHHANIVAYRHTWVETAKLADFGPKSTCLFILMEYANAGSLDSVLEYAKNHVIDESQIWWLFSELLQGLHYLAHHGIVHRDLKPANILLSRELDEITRKEVTRVLISDFGQCETLAKIHRLPRTGFTGTMLFAAPELLLPNQEYDHSCDIYSLGICLYSIAYGVTPYEEASLSLDQKSLAEKILEDGMIPIPNFPKRSRDLQELLLEMTNPNPKLRPSADQLLEDPRFILNSTLHSTTNIRSYYESNFLSTSASEDGPPSHNLLLYSSKGPSRENQKRPKRTFEESSKSNNLLPPPSEIKNIQSNPADSSEMGSLLKRFKHFEEKRHSSSARILSVTLVLAKMWILLTLCPYSSISPEIFLLSLALEISSLSSSLSSGRIISLSLISSIVPIFSLYFQQESFCSQGNFSSSFRRLILQLFVILIIRVLALLSLS